jgi:hypothetical protein
MDPRTVRSPLVLRSPEAKNRNRETRNQKLEIENCPL